MRASMAARATAMVALLGCLALVSACATHTHVVGQGASEGQSESARQWYGLWGLVQVNEVDTNAMADGATDYTITTQHGAIDFLINTFTSAVSVHSRTVQVTR